MATGLPSVRPWRTPATTSARSFSIFMRPPRPCPSWRRARSRSMSSGRSCRPAGSPSTIAVRPGPWDSPAVTKRKDMAPTPYLEGAGATGSESGPLLEGNVVLAATRVRVGDARVHRVDRRRRPAEVDRRDRARHPEAPGRLAVAVEVLLDLVQLDDVVDVVVVLIVLAVEQRVAVHVRVGQVEVGERPLVEVARPVAAVGLLLPRLNRGRKAAVICPEGLPEVVVAGPARRFEPVVEPVSVGVALLIAP